MSNKYKFAIIFVAVYAISTGAWGQKVYKCGSSYSQTPCADGKVIDVADERSKDEKTAADRATTRDMRIADEMERKRVKEERDAVSAAGPKEHRLAKTPSKAKKKDVDKESESTTLGPKKKSKGKSKEPEFFTAKSGADKK